MGSDLYRVTTQAKQDRKVSLAVRVVHPDAGDICDDLSFALMILFEATQPSDPLAREVAFDDTLDKGWVTRYATGFIKAVSVKAKSRLDITVTDPAWIAHIKPKLGWDSRAFALGVKHYEPHAPIAPGDGGGTATAADGEGFVWVPRENFLSMIDATTPALLEVPAYAESAYAVADTLVGAKLTRKALAAWLGKAVAVEDDSQTSYGALVAVGPQNLVTLARLSGGGSGSSRTHAKSVGRLTLKQGRRGTALGYDRVLAATPTLVTSAKKSGASVELVLQLPPDGRTVSIESETDVLALLASPLMPAWDGPDRLKPAALSKALEADLETHELRGLRQLDTIYPWVAKQYIAAFTLDQPRKSTSVLKVDRSKIRAALEAPWPTATLHVTVTDKKWIAHLDATPNIEVRTDAYPPPEAPPPRAPDPEPAVAADARAVLWVADKVWIAERSGTSWKARWGQRSKTRRQEKVYTLGSAEKAQAAFDKAVAAKLKERYKRAPSRVEAESIVWKRLGLTFEPSLGPADNNSSSSAALIVVKVGAPASTVKAFDSKGFEPKDRITSVIFPDEHWATVAVATVEEVAAAIEKSPKGTRIQLDTCRPSNKRVWDGGGSSTSLNLTLK